MTTNNPNGGPALRPFDYGGVVRGVSKLRRGQVWCKTCGRSEKVDSGECLRHGWPTCCGYTMTIDSPAEREAMLAERDKSDG